MNALLTSPQSGVAKDLLRRGKKVETAAKKELQNAPRRVNTGLLRSSINTQLITVGGKLAVRVGTNVYYAIFVHDGTGLYGPAGHLIRPKTRQALKWLPKKGGGFAFAKYQRGMRPNHFFRNALKAAKD